MPPKPVPIPEAIRALGPLSVGHPHAGYLVNGIKLPERDDWVITVPSHGYGTEETVEALGHCIGKVRRAMPDSPKVMLGSLSAERGGFLPPHKSHRTGRDVDVYFFRQPGAKWSKAATKGDIDLERTWALLRCFVTETDVEMILIDRRVQAWLEAHALSAGEDPEWVEVLFHDQRGHKTSIVRHVPGHVAHMHVRFESPKARRAGVRHYDQLVAAGLVVPEQRALVHEVAKGDTLSSLAARYGLTVARIRELNELAGTVIRVGQKLTLLKPVDLRGARDPVYVRPRHLPPAKGEAVVVARDDREEPRVSESSPAPEGEGREPQPLPFDPAPNPAEVVHAGARPAPPGPPPVPDVDLATGGGRGPRAER